MTETTAARPNRRPWIIAGIVLVLAIVLLGVAALLGSQAAGSTADDYESDFAAWKDEQAPVLLAATDPLPKGTYVTKRQNQKAELATQTKGCDQVAASLAQVEEAGDSLPDIGGSAFGALSSDYGDTSDLADERKKTVDAYVKAATATLSQLERDCRWNIEFNTSSTRSTELYEKSDEYLLEAGGAEPGATCPVEVACVSSITAKKNTYADLRIKALKDYAAKTKDLWADDECGETSYGAVCAALERSASENHAASLKAYEFIRETKSTIDNNRISTDSEAITKVNERNDARILKAMLAEVPELNGDKKIEKSPFYTDLFFPRVAKLLLADLAEQRAAIEKL